MKERICEVKMNLAVAYFCDSEGILTVALEELGVFGQKPLIPMFLYGYEIDYLVRVLREMLEVARKDKNLRKKIENFFFNREEHLLVKSLLKNIAYLHFSKKMVNKLFCVGCNHLKKKKANVINDPVPMWGNGIIH